MSVQGNWKVWLDHTLDSASQFNKGVLQAHNWVVVPVESAAHFDESEIERIASACNRVGVKELNAVLIENLKEVQPHFRFDATKEGLRGFNNSCAHFNYALVPDDCSFAIVCTTDDYYLLGGPLDVVESCLGRSIVEAREAFDAFSRSEEWTPEQRRMLQELSRRYRE